MTSDTEPSGIITYSSHYDNSYSGRHAFDGETAYYGSGWYSRANSAMPQWLSYQFPSAKTIVQYRMMSTQNDGPIGAWEFQGSNDGTSWTILDTQGVPTNITWAVRVFQTFDIPNTNAYLHYRVYATVGDGTYASIMELQMFEAFVAIPQEEIGREIMHGPVIFTDDGATETTSTIAVSGGTFGAGANALTVVAGTGAGASVGLPPPSATWNPNDMHSSLVLTNGNLTIDNPHWAWFSARATIFKSSGKWSWETTIINAAVENIILGISVANSPLDMHLGGDPNGGAFGYQSNGYIHNPTAGGAYGTTYTNGDVIRTELDMDNLKLQFFKNNEPQGLINISANAWFPAISPLVSSAVTNFGATPFVNQPTAGFNMGVYNNPVSSGTFTSLVINLGTKADFTTMTYATTLNGQTITIDARAGNTDTPDESWTGWQTGIVSGGSIIGLTGLIGNQYIQYRANLSRTNTTVTPTLDSVTINYSQYDKRYITSSAYNTGFADNGIGKVAWTGTGITETAYLKFQVRSSSNGNTWSEWCGQADIGNNCLGTNFFTTSGTEMVPGTHPLNTGNNDQYIQYKVFFIDNTGELRISSATITYGLKSVGFIASTNPFVSYASTGGGSEFSFVNRQQTSAAKPAYIPSRASVPVVSIVPGCVTGDRYSALTGKVCFPSIAQKLTPALTPKLALVPKPVSTTVVTPTVEPVPVAIEEPILEPVLTPEPTPVSEVKQKLVTKVVSSVTTTIANTVSIVTEYLGDITTTIANAVSIVTEYLGDIMKSILGWFTR